MRDYDPTTGRYLQADPLGLVDGASVYGYAAQSPLRFTDPTGELIPVVAIVVILAVLLTPDAANAPRSCDAIVPLDPFAPYINGVVAGVTVAPFAAAANSLRGGSAASTSIAYVTLPRATVKNFAAGIGATTFEKNLISSGYAIVSRKVGSNGVVTIISNGQKTYAVYTSTSTGAASVQVTNSIGKTLSKIRLCGP